MARAAGAQRLFTVGELSAIAVASFGKAGRHFADYRELIDALIDCMHARMTVLVKGSRAMHMERIVDGIVKRQPTAPDGAGRAGSMLSHLFHSLAGTIFAFNVFCYLTFRGLLGVVTSLAMLFLIVPAMIRRFGFR